LRANDDRQWHAHSGISVNAKLGECSQVFNRLAKIN
jgi:hypothetical protein